MEKLLSPKDRILLGLSIIGDLFFEIAEPPSITIGKLKGGLPSDYRTTNFYASLYRTLRTGEIEKIIKNGQAYYRLTSAGKDKIKRDFSLLKLQNQKWDGLWRMVIFDIAEKNKIIRNILRYKLKELGFGRWQKSVYITPFNVAKDMQQFLYQKRLTNQACVLITKQLFIANIKNLANKIWGLEDLNREYEDLQFNWEQNKNYLNYEQLKQEARKSYSSYMDLISKDPFLPVQLLPLVWHGNEIKKTVKEWLSYLN